MEDSLKKRRITMRSNNYKGVGRQVVGREMVEKKVVGRQVGRWVHRKVGKNVGKEVDRQKSRQKKVVGMQVGS